MKAVPIAAAGAIALVVAFRAWGPGGAESATAPAAPGDDTEAAWQTGGDTGRSITTMPPDVGRMRDAPDATERARQEARAAEDDARARHARRVATLEPLDADTRERFDELLAAGHVAAVDTSGVRPGPVDLRRASRNARSSGNAGPITGPATAAETGLPVPPSAREMPGLGTRVEDTAGSTVSATLVSDASYDDMRAFYLDAMPVGTRDNITTQLADDGPSSIDIRRLDASRRTMERVRILEDGGRTYVQLTRSALP